MAVVMRRHALLALACVLATPAICAADSGCQVQITVRTPGRELNRNVAVQCWSDVAADLEHDLVQLTGFESHAVQFGEANLETQPDPSSGGNRGTHAVLFPKPFPVSPAVITRISEVVVEGPDRCATWLEQSKLQITPEGFTLAVEARPGCAVISAKGEWLGFTISPSDLINALNPRWLRPLAP